ncbi:MAG: thioredoxin family protein [Microthrixaceae bacterium]
MKLELLYFDDCPNWKIAAERLDAIALTRGLAVERRLVTTAAEAEAARFRGSPTVLVDGRDPFASGDEPFGLACRVYQTPDGPAGSPTIEQLEVAVDA